MDSYLPIFQGLLSTGGSFLDLYLDGLEGQSKFDVQSNEGIELVQHISSLLTKSTTRILGLRLLSKFIDQFSIDIFERKGSLWTTLVVKVFNNQELRNDAPLILEVLDKIIKRSYQSPDLSKSFASTHISKIYESVANVPLSEAKYALKCIETCLRLYPGSSGPSRSIIERFLWKNVDNFDVEVVENCGKCLHQLQQIKGGAIQGVNHKTQWKNYQLQLLGGIHTVYNEMFSKCIEMYEEKIEQEKLPWETQKFEFDPEPIKKAAQMYTRCHNMIKYLIIALREPFPVEKPILLKKILNVVVRGLSVNCIMLEQNPIADNIALSILLPKLHIDLIELLNVTILVLRGHLRPYSELILGLIVDSLKWISVKNSQRGQKLLLALRKKLYETVSLWCTMFFNGNRCDTISEHLFQEILSDITPAQSEFTLKVLSGARKHMSKKARRQLYNIQNEKSNMAQIHSNDSNRKEKFSEEKKQDLCISALRCLQEVFFSVANFIKPTVLKIMQTSVIQICAILYELSSQHTHLYSNKNCRKEIYNTLYAMLMTPHHLCPPPTEMILTIIQTAYARDDSLTVRIQCGFILRNLEKVFHPQKESLLYTIEARDIRNTFIKLGQESLLREFEFSNTLCADNEIDYSNVPQSNKATNSQFLNTLTNCENESDVLKNCNKPQATGTTISKNIELIHNTNIFVADKNVNDPKDNTTDIIELDPSKDQVDDEAFMETNTTNKNVDIIPKSPEIILRIDEDEDITTVDEQEANKDDDIGKQYIINLEDDEDNLLADIASQFVDELD